MKPNNNRNNNGNNNNNSYFAQNIKDKGENFLDYKNARDMENESMRIFRELARGKIDLNKYGHYFLDQQFLHSIIKTANDKFLYFNISYNGVQALVYNYTMQGVSADANILKTLETHKKSTEAYYIILQHLEQLKVNRDINILYVLANNLANFRYNI